MRSNCQHGDGHFRGSWHPSGEPQSHCHGAIHLDGCRQFRPHLLSLAGGGVLGARTQVAVRHKRAHTKLLCQGQGLLVMGFGLHSVRETGVGIDNAKLVQRTHRVLPDDRPR
jgi:hypothetical protein